MPQLRLIGALLFCLAAALPQAQAESVSITELSWTDKQFMAAQLARVDELVRSEMGAQIHGKPRDIDVLQRVVNRNLVDRNDAQTQQALGLVLGNVIANKTGMQWVAYKDSNGRSRALCVKDTSDCLFPMTMLARRMAVGLYPDVNKIYQEAMEMVQPLVNKSPYDVATESEPIN
ncbi:DUF3806 domain-containing protein [Simiduia sp. 21SJ11W-1]|uniref:DUF3806 domain-containing protein n=1 Tax=Simiduia sp. 21SJ11W-1 TaxID=2909669 RepID=UPI00209FDA3D|nr:DUF3806 domain-containing protein [Simiduia sp. 21SJ11W-1]UTA46377.1 DUF3806 domain-containing protein [Simiduia sp. 21SJ11W-1]